MNYQIITDQSALEAFIDWLPELKPEETYYLCLFGRSKYCKGIAHVRSDKAQLRRFTSNKERMVEKIMQLECPVGAYSMKEVGNNWSIALPQEAIALYITINPRSFLKANTASVKKLLDLALQPYNGYHPYQEVMSEVQKAKSRSEFINFDFDISKDEDTLSLIKTDVLNIINPSALTIVETRGGYHFIIRPKFIANVYLKNWYQNMRSILATYSADHDNAGDIMLPVPGTYQGGFTPKFINL